MNMLTFIISLMAVVVISHVTATNSGFGSYFPGLSYPSSGLWTGGLGGGYSQWSGFGGFKFPSSNVYLPRGVQKPVSVFSEGGSGGGEDLGNGELILVLVLFLVLTGTILTNRTPTTSGNGVIILITFNRKETMNLQEKTCLQDSCRRQRATTVEHRQKSEAICSGIISSIYCGGMI